MDNNRYSVLLVDDEEDIIRIIMKKLDWESMGLTIIGHAANGVEALELSLIHILGNLLQQMYNAVDSIIVGNYVGSNALAAVGAGASLIYLLIAFSLGASVGAGRCV